MGGSAVLCLLIPAAVNCHDSLTSATFLVQRPIQKKKIMFAGHTISSIGKIPFPLSLPWLPIQGDLAGLVPLQDTSIGLLKMAKVGSRTYLASHACLPEASCNGTSLARCSTGLITMVRLHGERHASCPHLPLRGDQQRCGPWKTSPMVSACLLMMVGRTVKPGRLHAAHGPCTTHHWLTWKNLSNCSRVHH